MQVVTNKGSTILGHIHCVRQNGHGLPYRNNRLQNPLHTTTYLIITHEPILVPPQNFYHIPMTQLLFTKKFKEFKAAFFELLIIKAFNEML